MKLQRIKQTFQQALALSTLLAFGACSNSASQQEAAGSDGTDNGEVIIGLTDAPGDFSSYRVDVLSLNLTRADGLVVETLPTTTSFDFSEYVDLTEFLTAASLPTGVYTSGTLQLDYSNADIQVENELGDVIPASSILDENGESLDQIEVTVNLDGQQRLIVARGVVSHLTVDFDLQASNSVAFDTLGNAIVTVSPVLHAELEHDDAKTHRARGALLAVDTDASQFTLALRPYRQRLASNTRFGEMNIVTDDETRFDIDGVSTVGSHGLATLSQHDTGTAVVALGHYRREPRRFVATDVIAGTSLPGNDHDAVIGVVLSRDADRLRMGGASISKADGLLIIGEAVTVILDSDTAISAFGNDAVLQSDAISVGQHITAWGDLGTDEQGEMQLTTAEGGVRMHITWLAGLARGSANALEVGLSRLAGRNPQRFDFTGTGVSVDFDADPEAYEIDTGSLDTSSIASGTAIRVAGLVQPFGTAPADFSARTLVDVSALPATLRVSWPRGESAALDTSSGTSLMINLLGSGRFHTVSQRGIKTDLGNLDSAPLVRLDNGSSIQVIARPRSRQVFTDYLEFINALDSHILDGGEVFGLASIGIWNAQLSELSATRTTVHLR